MAEWLLQGDIKMYKIIIFAGTTEGRMVAEGLNEKNIQCLICTATEYGKNIIEEKIHADSQSRILAKRLNEEEMKTLFKENRCLIVIDATHPFARQVSQNIKNACRAKNCEYIRIIRKSEEIKDGICFESIEKAVEFLNMTKGNILVTTGSRQLEAYTRLDNYKERIFARVLPAKESIEKCMSMGIDGNNLICMQGPFSEEMNVAMLKQINAKWLVTKESGNVGGFLEKVKAVKKADAGLIIIKRPEDESGITVDEAIEYVSKKYDDNNINLANKEYDLETKDSKKEKKGRINVVGIGMGNEEMLTRAALNAIKEADIIIGARRMTDILKNISDENATDKPTFISYKKEEIKNFLNQNDYKKIVILMSGDTGFFSGSRGMSEYFDEYEVTYICGISSMSYFMSRLNKGYEDVKIVSLHGRRENIIDIVRTNKKVFAILDRADTVKEIAQKLIYYGFKEISFWIGENLGSNLERIRCFKAENINEILNTDILDLCVIYIENKNADNTYGSISDAEFIRGNVPMTKEEVRSISISKLNLDKTSVIWDIGAGTGSVSIEMAKRAVEGMVYAIEKNPEAAVLIKENMRKFQVSNISIIEGTAPFVLDDLDTPSHCFIGGSGKNMEAIINKALQKNKNVIFVINVIALESLAELINILKQKNFSDVDIIQINVSKAKKAADYNLMMGQNPVYIIKCSTDNPE